MYVLAIDIGASSGRHILGSLENGRLKLEEVYRFPNGFAKKDGYDVWDTEALFDHIVKGMRRCREIGKIPSSVGVDTWGVDFVLVDKNGNRVSPAVAYRDKRTEKVQDQLPEEALYSLTGIARQPFNTVYQLMATPKEWLKKADRCLFVPDYFHFLLSGKMANEYTESSTSSLLSVKTRTWDEEVFKMADIPLRLFPENPKNPGTVLGDLTPEIQEKVGYNCQVILPASHDTGSAYMAVPAQDENSVFLSSGTWSLLGMETDEPIATREARKIGFTNEGAYGGRTRFLRNIMGLWMLQCIRHENDDRYSFGEMADMAAQSSYPCTVDVGNNRFLAPDNMSEEVKAALKEQGSPLPQNLSDLLCCVNKSLARCYAGAISDLSRMCKKTFTAIHIVGGGSKNKVLNQWTANAARLPVYAGPDEGTSLGNVMAQMISLGLLKNLQEGRNLIRENFEITKYLPQE